MTTKKKIKKKADEAMNEYIKKRCWAENQIRQLAVDETMSPEETFKRLDAIYTIGIFEPDTWELCVTHITAEIADRCEAIESYLANEFRDRKPTQQLIKGES